MDTKFPYIFSKLIKEKYRFDMAFARAWVSYEGLPEEEADNRRKKVRLLKDGTQHPTDEDIVEFCDLFDCTPDYLLGFSDTPRHETGDIQKLLGLSEEASNKLLEWAYKDFDLEDLYKNDTVEEGANDKIIDVNGYKIIENEYDDEEDFRKDISDYLERRSSDPSFKSLDDCINTEVHMRMETLDKLLTRPAFEELLNDFGFFYHSYKDYWKFKEVVGKDQYRLDQMDINQDVAEIIAEIKKEVETTWQKAQAGASANAQTDGGKEE